MVAGAVVAESTTVGVDQLLYLGSIAARPPPQSRAAA